MSNSITDNKDDKLKHYSDKLEIISNKYQLSINNLNDNNNSAQKSKSFLKEVHSEFVMKYNDIINNLSSLIETIQNIKNENEIKEVEIEESPASKPQKKPHSFENIDKHRQNVALEENDTIISTILQGWCTVKIKGSLENGIEDSLEVVILSKKGTGEHGSGFMFGVVNDDEDIPLGVYPGERFFSFASHGDLYSKNSIEGDYSSRKCGNWDQNDRLRLSLDPNSGQFSLDINDERRLDLKLIIL